MISIAIVTNLFLSAVDDEVYLNRIESMKTETKNLDKYEETQAVRIRAEFHKYVTQKQSLMMATVNQASIPDVSYAPFVIDEQFNIYVFVSDIVERTRNLLDNGKVSLLFIEDESACQHIFARKRVTMQANAESISAESPELARLQQLFYEKFGEFVNLEIISKSDFHLIRMIPYEAGLTKGFGLAFRLTGEGLQDVEHLKKGHSNKSKEEKVDGAA